MTRGYTCRAFDYFADGADNENKGQDFAHRVLDRHRELRHRFTASTETQFAAEAGLSPTEATPIAAPTSRSLYIRLSKE